MQNCKYQFELIYITKIMAYLSYSQVWHWISIDGSTLYDFYGKNFNPNVPAIPGWNTFTCYQQTSNFNLTGFQPWNEVWCYIRNISDINPWHLYVEAFLQVYRWWWQYLWGLYWEFDETSWDVTYAWYMYFWVDSDEIWDYGTEYRIITNWEYTPSWWTKQWETWKTVAFTVSNLNIDTTLCKPWYLWIEWNNLCYTDATWWDWWHPWYWWKHKINYDTWYNWWTWEPWYIWIPSGVSWRIYYVDAYGIVRRTHYADTRYWGSSHPSWAIPWRIWVSDWNANTWYWYLCFIDWNWEQMRMWNWTP